MTSLQPTSRHAHTFSCISRAGVASNRSWVCSAFLFRFRFTFTTVYAWLPRCYDFEDMGAVLCRGRMAGFSHCDLGCWTHLSKLLDASVASPRLIAVKVWNLEDRKNMVALCCSVFIGVGVVGFKYAQRRCSQAMSMHIPHHAQGQAALPAACALARFITVLCCGGGLKSDSTPRVEWALHASFCP